MEGGGRRREWVGGRKWRGRRRVMNGERRGGGEKTSRPGNFCERITSSCGADRFMLI